MEDYRSYHATPNQIDSLWSVIWSLRQQVEDLTRRLQLVEGGRASETVAAPAEVTAPASTLGT